MNGLTSMCRVLLLVSWLGAALAWAQPASVIPPAPKRMAVVVGSNSAVLGRTALRYAHVDARQMADVLIQVGEFQPGDVELLLDPAPEAILAALDQKLRRLRATPGPTLLLFYYSGHADQQALYPHGEPLELAALKQRIESPDATVRLGIIDACRGGGWTQTKGLHADAPFELADPLHVQSEGSVLIASSSGLENAHEAAAVEGSFFTHHFVAGLRGAADVAGDGEVSMLEAFTYAKQLTIRDTAVFADQPQHPSFDLNLRGRDDLSLTRVATGGSVVVLRQRRGPLQVVQASEGLSVLELPAGEREVKVALRPGRYVLIRKVPDGPVALEFNVQAEQSLLIEEESLVPASFASITAKGPEANGSSPPNNADRLLTTNLLSLAFGAAVQFEYAQALSPAWMLTVTPSLSAGSEPIAPAGSDDWAWAGSVKRISPGLQVGVRYHPHQNAPAGLYVGAQMGVTAALLRRDDGSMNRDKKTFLSLLSNVDVGYSFLFWNHAALSLGMGVEGVVVSQYDAMRQFLVQAGVEHPSGHVLFGLYPKIAVGAAF
ncbi:caspase family protein [Myxococcaceae bacterium JPH2]|nr:caspase family protein [Myxococcaceae bacterium JPH2]